MRVTVIGAGFAGLLTTVHLLRHPGVRVTLIEKRLRAGVGAAYSTDNPDHLLNVRTSNMSAFPDEPAHLRLWLARQGLPAGADAFISRKTYGDYLQGLLAGLADDPVSGRRLRLVRGEAMDLRHDGDWRLAVEGEAEVRSDAVVLALGNLEPVTPAALGEIAASPLYVSDPWRDLHQVPESATRILLLGSGLTMVDAAISLQGPDRKIIAISRRGLLPHSHAQAEPLDPVSFQGGPVEVLAQVRAWARTADWRAVIDQLRPRVQDIWRSWSIAQRRMALRHLKPFWDVHRHRLAPEIASRIAWMRASGQLSIHAGKVVRATPVAQGIRIDWRARRSAPLSSMVVDAVINCTGPQADITRSDLSLLRTLLGRGLVTADEAGLGARVDAHHRLIDSGGRPTAGLYAVGGLTRGASWETTAVPEIRVQVAEVAASIVADRTAGLTVATPDGRRHEFVRRAAG